MTTNFDIFLKKHGIGPLSKDEGNLEPETLMSTIELKINGILKELNIEDSTEEKEEGTTNDI